MDTKKTDAINIIFACFGIASGNRRKMGAAYCVREMAVRRQESRVEGCSDGCRTDRKVHVR